MRLLLLLTVLLPLAAHAETIAYWAQNDNDLPGGGFGFQPGDFPQPADVGNGSLDLTDFVTDTDGDGVLECIPSFAGTSDNALPEFDSGGSLAPQGCSETANNGMAIELAVDTSGYRDLVVSWAQRGTGTGFDSRQFAWSADGGATFTDLGSDTGALGSSWSVQSYDLAGIEALEDSDSVVFRITLDGASSATGNNRFDNIRVDGEPLGNGGAPGTAPIPFELEFSTDPYTEGFSAFDVSGLENWEWNPTFDNVTFSSFDGSCVPSESWFVSPAFDLDAQDDELLSIDVQRGFSGDDPLDLLYSTDYDGQGDPSEADWSLLQSVTADDFSSNNTPVTFGPFSELQAESGTVRVAARGLYASGECSTWRVSRFAITLDDGGPGDFACSDQPGEDDTLTRIHAIQGDGFASPIEGQNVEVQAIVVGTFQDTGADQIGGFFVQERDSLADEDPLTSEGIRIAPDNASTSIPTLAIGDEVRLAGEVRERFGQTELFALSAIESCAADQLAEVSPAELVLPVDDPIEFEAVEGMWVRLTQALTVNEVFNAARFAEFSVATDRLFEPTQVVEPGAPANARQDLNDRSRLIIDQGRAGNYQTPYQPGLDGTPLDASNPIRVGYRMQPDFDGVMGFGFDSYRLFSLQPAEFDAADNPRTAEPPELPEGDLRLATFNVENLFTTLQTGGVGCGPNDLNCRGATSASELERQRDKLVSAISALEADLLGLVEVENDADDSTLQFLVDAINDQDPVGDWSFIATGFKGTDAIKNAIVYRSANLTPVGDFAVLDSDTDIEPPIDTSRQRPVLAQAFAGAGGEVFNVSVVHFRSKNCGSNASGDNADQGDGQGCWNALRTESVESLQAWLATDPTDSGTDRHLVLGDFNAYALEDPLQVFVDAGWVNQAIAANAGDPAVYNFVFRGQSGSLDHVLASPAMNPEVRGAVNWPVNADEIPAFAYPETLPSSSIPKPENFYQADPFRSSDHDPLLIGIEFRGDGLFADRFEQP